MASSTSAALSTAAAIITNMPTCRSVRSPRVADWAGCTDWIRGRSDVDLMVFTRFLGQRMAGRRTLGTAGSHVSAANSPDSDRPPATLDSCTDACRSRPDGRALFATVE